MTKYENETARIDQFFIRSFSSNDLHNNQIQVARITFALMHTYTLTHVNIK